MPVASCMGVVAAFRLLIPLSSFHKIWYERYSVSADTIIFLLQFPRSILITTWRFNQLVTIERYWQP